MFNTIINFILNLLSFGALNHVKKDAESAARTARFELWRQKKWYRELQKDLEIANTKLQACEQGKRVYVITYPQIPYIKGQEYTKTVILTDKYEGDVLDDFQQEKIQEDGLWMSQYVRIEQVYPKAVYLTLAAA